MNVSDCYKLLDVKEDATEEQIKHAYRDLVKVWHPDRFAHDPKLRQKAETKLKEINHAYSILLESCKNGQSARRRATEDTSRKREDTSNKKKPYGSGEKNSAQQGEHTFWWICPNCLSRNLSSTLRCKCNFEADDNSLIAFAESRTAADLLHLAESFRQRGQRDMAVFFAQYLVKRFPNSSEAATIKKHSPPRHVDNSVLHSLKLKWNGLFTMDKVWIGLGVCLAVFLLVGAVKGNLGNNNNIVSPKSTYKTPPQTPSPITRGSASEPSSHRADTSKNIVVKTPGDLFLLPSSEPASGSKSNHSSLNLGAAPFGKGIYGGRSTLTVINGTSRDALVKVVTVGSNPRMIRNFYIPADKTFTANSMPKGSYVLKVAYGKDWNKEKKKFTVSRSFSLSDPFELKEILDVVSTENGVKERIRYSTSSITLHKVVDGNFHTKSIDEDQFDSGG